MLKIIGLGVLLSSLLLAPVANAIERITRFHSEITVLDNGVLDVVETISVMAEHRQIRRGIYRDFPTIYPHDTLGALGLHQNTDFQLISVERDGSNAPWHTQNLQNGIRIFIGNRNQLVSIGQHTYELHYRSKRQLQHNEQHDLLVWNVTGQGWTFPIEQASAQVTFPGRINPVLTDAWTGKQNSQEKQFRANASDAHSVFFESTSALPPYHGLSIQLGTASGAIQANPANAFHFLGDNWKWLLALFGLLGLPIYFLKAWIKVGKDPRKGVIVADYHPVRGLSPAAHRFISSNQYDDTTFAAAILNMAVKGWLTIKQESKKSFTLTKTLTTDKNTQTQVLSAGEQRLFDELFRANTHIQLGKKYQANVATAKSRLSAYLRNEFRNAIYRDNSRYSWYGLIISLLVLGLFAWHISNGSDDALSKLALSGGLFLLIAITPIFGKQILTFLPVAGIVVWTFIQGNTSTFNTLPFTVLCITVAGLYVLFYYLLRAPTPFGRQVLDEIEGFRLYLSTAEQNRLNILHPPEQTPELFEQLLPYALALGVENQWSEQFSSTIGPNAPEQQQYTPSWYHGGRFNHFGSSGFATAIGAGLASSVAAAATAPSSTHSSGGFGGGAGGGGGGGGGW